jgi:putative spermidine/putrescine transport system permease protein
VRALSRVPAAAMLLGPLVLLLVAFFSAPLVLMLGISFTRESFGQISWQPTLLQYARFFSDSFYLGVLWDTLVLGAITTAAALLMGYPLAWHLARTTSRWKPVLLVFVLSPLLVGIVIRCYGWMILLADRGLVNAMLIDGGWRNQPLPLMYNRFGVTVALVHVFLPFMVLSLTGVLKRLDPHLLEAAMTLGASPFRAFLEVTLPLSLPGILAGSLLVFSLAISSFVVPILLGGFKVQVLPMIIYEQMLSVFDWPFGAANAFVLLVLSVILIALYIRATERALRGIR